jgi:hypothetical protein
MPGERGSLRADPDSPQPLPGPHHEASATVFEPIRAIFIIERDEMKIVPRWPARPIAD